MVGVGVAGGLGVLVFPRFSLAMLTPVARKPIEVSSVRVGVAAGVAVFFFPRLGLARPEVCKLPEEGSGSLSLGRADTGSSVGNSFGFR